MAANVTCPDCGASNRGDANTCRLCGTLLKPELKTRRRIQQKILRRTDFLAAARANQANTRKLILVLTAIGTALGYLIGWALQSGYGALPAPGSSPWFFSSWGITGAFVLLAASLLWTGIALQTGDRIVMRMTGAREVTADDEPQLCNVVEEMALAAGLPRPRTFVIETPAMNAFATGMRPDRAAIAVTRGLLENLNRDELQGVIGHEMGHVANWDIRYATAVSVMVGLIALVSDGILRSVYYGGLGGRRRSGNRDGGGAVIVIIMVLFAVVAPLAAKLVQMAVSRQREFLADATSVRLTRNPLGLISALQKLADQAEPFKGANRATQHLFIVNPFRNFSDKASALMATHPPLERRITRLRNLGAD
ncbi:MAG: M48 family metalloprotease [Gammaproteobacteria bacterium]